MTDTAPHFANDDHALLAGMFLGVCLKAGINIRPELDDDLNYKNAFVIGLDDADPSLKVRVVVAPPLDG